MSTPRKPSARGAGKPAALRRKATGEKAATKAAALRKKASTAGKAAATKKTSAAKKARPAKKSPTRKSTAPRTAAPHGAPALPEPAAQAPAEAPALPQPPAQAPGETPALARLDQLDERIITVGAAPAEGPQAALSPDEPRRGLRVARVKTVFANGSRPQPPPFPQTNHALVERVLVAFVHDEVSRVGLDRVVLGLSGGVDSACAAAIAARALGPERVLGVMMPYRSSNPASERDARAVAQALGIRTHTVDITPQIDAYFGLCPDASKERRGNKMARERMTILYDLSAAERALVLGTSNKTELLLGYGTLYGDMASALNPIGDLYKTQIWGLAERLGVPAQIVRKPPSADLWEGQTDEHELGFSYADVDALLYRMVDERWTDDELVAAGFDAALFARVRVMVRGSQFKRRLPLIAKVSERTIDADFRYPRDWGT